MTDDMQTETQSRGCLERLVRTRWNVYFVWRRQMADRTCPGQWLQTQHHFKARTAAEAESRLRRMFANCGFTAMSLAAMPSGESPNDPSSATASQMKPRPETKADTGCSLERMVRRRCSDMSGCQNPANYTCGFYDLCNEHAAKRRKMGYTTQLLPKSWQFVMREPTPNIDIMHPK